MKVLYKLIILFGILFSLLLSSCTAQNPTTDGVNISHAELIAEISSDNIATFTLKTYAEGGKLLYIGIGGDLDGVINPDLIVEPGSVVRIVLINGDGMPHDLFLPDFNTKTDYVTKIGDQTEIVVDAGEFQPGTYVYYCTVPGHRQAGQEGKLIIQKLDKEN